MVPTSISKGENLNGERIVISGMSGLYPDSHNVQELADILYNKVNPVSDKNPRWTYHHPGVAYHTGKVPGLELFDAQFFKVHYRLANNMDPSARKLLEQAYQAIYDAGVSPAHLNGKKVGVYVGSCFSETEKGCFYRASSKSGHGIAGCNKAMYANRISYWLNVKGPSYVVNTACCSSSTALEQAYMDMERGECEAAIVGGAQLCLHPQCSIQYGKIIKLSMDGKTKSFDKNADGCSRSEAVCVFLLQKKKDALRIYAELLNVENRYVGIKNNDITSKYGPYRDTDAMSNFISNFYEKTGISPSLVEFVEAFGSANPEADKDELEVLDEVFCGNRKKPFLVGSVMSNLGYCDAASGLVAITKVLLGYHKGEIAANLHCDTPQDVQGLTEGRMQIVTDHEKLQGTYTAINGISVSGLNSHILLHGNYKPKDLNRYKSAIPHLVTLSGRVDSCVKTIFDELKSNPIDPEQLALLHNINTTAITGHLARGFIILDTNDEGKTVSLVEKVDHFDYSQRPLVFLYSGMGSQWVGMGTQLMRIPIFSAAIERCHRVLKPKGIDIVDIITSPEKTMFDNILHSFVGIAAVQIGLTDVLRAVGLVPDFIIGHSVGELGCAYADDCFTAEEMILAAYYRGLVSVETPFIRGSMAAIGIGYKKIKDMCPPEIEVACHNGPDSCTISGPADIMKQFVSELTAKQIFAKEVPCSNIAYHSRYIAGAGPGLLKYLSEAIKTPKARSKRWLSTSVPEDRWDDATAKFSSAEYHTNNLLNPVLFEETSRLLPVKAVVLEIAPHGLLQAIVKRSLPKTCCHVPLTKRDHADNACFMLEALGKLYMEGYLPKVDVLYPKVEFPVSTGTPFLSSLVDWVHDEKWHLLFHLSSNRTLAATCTFVISIHDDEHSYLLGNCIGGKILYPFAAALVCVWDTLAMCTGQPKKQLSVQFSDVHLFAQPILHDRRQLRLAVGLQQGTGRFEVSDGNSTVATGVIVGKVSATDKFITSESQPEGDILLKSDDIYQLLQERDYSYEGDFRSIYSVNDSLDHAHVLWNNNWVTFIDGLLQLSVLRNDHDGVSEPHIIRSIGINVKEHSNHYIKTDGKITIEADFLSSYNSICCGGVTMNTVLFHNIPPIKEKLAVKSLRFIPRFSNENMDVVSILHMFLQIIAENFNKKTIQILDILSDDKNQGELSKVKDIVKDLNVANFQYEDSNINILKEHQNILQNSDVVLMTNLRRDENIIRILTQSLDQNTFLITLEKDCSTYTNKNALYNVLSSHICGNTRLSLIRWQPKDQTTETTVVTIRNHSDLASLCTTRAALPPKNKLVVLTSYPAITGLKELVDSWRKDKERNQIYMIEMSNDVTIDTMNQIPELDMAFNVLYKGMCGGQYFIPMNNNIKVDRGVSLESSRSGDINTLNWMEMIESVEAGVNVTVHYAGLNIEDAKKATGVHHYQEQKGYGMDFSGVTDRGCRVMGLIPEGAVSSQVRASPELLWPVPEYWSLEDAATVPLAYAQAFYCLVIKAKIYKGMSMLVHGGAGALGQALISIGLDCECEIFTTVSDVRKKRFLLKLFPNLKGDHIGNSRDHSFSDMVLCLTKGKGCDLVISCVDKQLKITTLRCSGRCGITLDLSKMPTDDYVLGMNSFTMDRTYRIVNFSSVFTKDNTKDLKLIHSLMTEGIALGYVRPLTRTTFVPQDAARALRFLAATRHCGRVLLHLQDFNMHAQPRINCTPDHCHVVFCQDDLGLPWVERLMARGARKFVIHLTDISNYALYKVRLWQQKGFEVRLTSEDLNDTKAIVSLFNDCIKMRPVEGVYVFATTANHKFDQKFVTYLDIMLRKLCPSLKYFAIVTADTALGQQTCIIRGQDQLPGTKVSLLGSKNKHPKISSHTAVDIMEKILCLGRNVSVAYPQKAIQKSLLSEIADIADVEVHSDNDNLILENLEDVKISEILKLLKDKYNVCIDNKQVKTFTATGVNSLDKVINVSTFDENVKGLEVFYSYVDPDELMATTETVFLPTLMENHTKRDQELLVFQKYLCIIPGLEGHYQRFSLLCERLKMPALVLQPGLDKPHETIAQMAERHAATLLKNVGLNTTFHLVGYECGILVALETARIFEDLGLTGIIYWIGGLPEEIQAKMEQEIEEYSTKGDLEDAVIQHMFLKLGGDSNARKILDFNKYYSSEEKVEACMRTLLGSVTYSTQYARAQIQTAISRIDHVRNYRPDPTPLRSQIILLQASDIQSSGTEIMSKYSQRPITIYNLRAPLAFATEDLRCASIINRHLEEELIEAFNEKNLCDSYMINNDIFTTVTQT